MTVPCHSEARGPTETGRNYRPCRDEDVDEDHDGAEVYEDAYDDVDETARQSHEGGDRPDRPCCSYREKFPDKPFSDTLPGLNFLDWVSIVYTWLKSSKLYSKCPCCGRESRSAHQLEHVYNYHLKTGEICFKHFIQWIELIRVSIPRSIQMRLYSKPEQERSEEESSAHEVFLFNSRYPGGLPIFGYDLVDLGIRIGGQSDGKGTES